jgi:hypothetical protein
VMPMFNEWMHDMPDGVEWDYRSHYNLPYPRYWFDSTQYEISQLTSSIVRLNFNENVLPNDYAHLDRPSKDCKTKVSFVINKAFMYAFVNGVRDFYCESEMNMAHRDHGDSIEKRHYDPQGYTDLKELFRSDIIKTGNHFKYDLSLSVSKLVHNYASWGSLLPRDFDPHIASSCYQHYSKRVIYSLPQHEEMKKDNWTAFLANNYKDFGSKITSIHSIDKSGAMIFFEDRSPVQFVGVDQLETEAGTKLTVGDGGLFSSPMSAIVAADNHFEYGSASNRMGIVNTPAGLFWVSPKTGRIFQYAGGLKPISNNGLKSWSSRYLPFQILRQFPQFELTDNPVVGVGYQLVYDNTLDVLYIAKKDYKVRDEYVAQMKYLRDNQFLIYGNYKVTLGDPKYFESASFTLSYDVKTESFISYHDWHPDYIIPSAVHFYTVKQGSLYKHNERSDLFCNFYGEDFPFEVEFPVPTGQDVTTLRSIEYQMECFRYYAEGRDRQHILDFNFDRAMVHNTEQHSGVLRLLNRPKNRPDLLIENPVIHSGAVDTYYSKEENKYRINQFFDLTRNRGEFFDNSQTMWEHAPNGYKKTVNPLYLAYTKPVLQRKKFRHYSNKVTLIRRVCSNVKMVLKIASAKQLKSFR